MSRFRNRATGVVFSVSDDKDHRYKGEGFGSPDEQEPAQSAYDAMTVVELKAEIASRNETRPDSDRMLVTGSKAELVGFLTADDETSE